MYVIHIVRFITLLVFMVTTLEGLAQAENWLQGQILENHGDTKKPAAGAQVWIVNVGNPYMTQVDGGYRVLVPDAYRIGQTIVLYVKRRGWAIATPVGGKVELKKDFTTDILLSPEASSEFLSPAQLDKLLESLPDKLKGQIKPDGKEGSADPAQVVKDYASEHGLPEGEVNAKVAALVKQYEQSSDLGKQCLAAIYRKDLKQAATRCEQNATGKVELLKKKRQEVETLSKGHLRSDCPVEPSFVYVSDKVIRVTNSGKRFQPNTETRESRVPRFVVSPTGKPTPEQLDEAKRQLLKLTEEVVAEFKATGDTYYANYQFDKALVSYKEGFSYVEMKDLPTLWADMQWLIGVANWQIGIRTKDAAIQEHLAEAVNRYGAAQTIYTKTEFPKAWAEIENALGAALHDQGTRTGSEAGTQLLAQAVAAYHEALTVYTKEALPQDWAMTQNNLGGVLQEQGTRASGEAGMQLLAQAVAAYRAALTVYTKDQLPQDWAMTQNNLGVVLRDQGSRTGGEAGTQLLAQAVAAYRAALTVRTKDTLPQQWAGTQMNLGVVLKEQGTHISGEAGMQLLAQAVAAYQAALTVYTKDQLPQDWAKTQNNLGIVLRNQGSRTDGEAGTQLLGQAVVAYRAALTVRTKDQLPQDWAMTQNNLGIVLRNQGVRASGTDSTHLLQAAEAAYRETLTVYTKDALPQDWAMIQNNLGLVLSDQGRRETGADSMRLLQAAEAAYRQALTVYTKALLPQDWARTQMNLGTVLSDQGVRVSGMDSTRLLQAAEAALLETFTVYTKEQFPQAWIDTSGSLTETLFLSSQFAKTRDHLAMLLDHPDLGPSNGIALLAIGISNSVALGTVERTQTELARTLSLLSQQGSDFFLTWDFSSIITFIDKNPIFAKHRRWLIELIKSFENGQRDEMLTAVQTARAAFRKATKP